MGQESQKRKGRGQDVTSESQLPVRTHLATRIAIKKQRRGTDVQEEDPL